MKKQLNPDRLEEMGLIAWLNKTRVILPLKAIQTQFEIHGALASVDVEQVYHQNNESSLDCTYTFPVPAGAAVHRCEVFINDRIIRAKIEDATQARKIFNQKKTHGRRAALVESNRENLFTLTLGNIQPQDLVVVRLSWIQTLDRSNQGFRLRIPTCPGIRYIPGESVSRFSEGNGLASQTNGVADALYLNPPRIDAYHPDAAYLKVFGRLSSGDFLEGSVSSPSHLIFARPEILGSLCITLADGGAIPDGDFILIWEPFEALTLAPKVWRWSDDAYAYAFVELRAPNHADQETDHPQDFYFLVDRSGSMQGRNWTAACKALHGFVRQLGPEDRVWITHFESDYSDFSNVPVPAKKLMDDPQFLNLETLGVGGGTQLLPAAEHVLQKIKTFSARRRVSIVLLTDGQVGNEAEILKAFRRLSRVRVHTFGIDLAVNDAFLKSLARQHQGGCWLQTPDDDISGIVAALGGRLKRPLLTNLNLEGAWETAGEALPDVHAQEVITLCLRTSSKDEPVVIRASLPNGVQQRYEIAGEQSGSEAVKLVWAREKMARLIATNRRKRAVQLAKQFNLACEGASFVAWDEAEQVCLATQNLYQPAMQPHADVSGDHSLSCLSYDLMGGTQSYSSGPDDLDLEQILRKRRKRAEPRAQFTANGFADAVSKLAPSALENVLQWPAYRSVVRKPKQSHPVFNELAEVVEWFGQWISHPLTKQEVSAGLCASVQALLVGSQDKFLNWAREFRLKWDLLNELFESLQKHDFIPKEQFSAVMAWIIQDTGIDEQRLEIACEQSERIEDIEGSGGDPRPVWNAFLAAVGLS